MVRNPLILFLDTLELQNLSDRKCSFHVASLNFIVPAFRRSWVARPLPMQAQRTPQRRSMDKLGFLKVTVSTPS